MEHKVVQISDIHIGGEYGGSFNCVENLKLVINEIIEKHSDIDFVIITGDLCDNHKEEEYIELDMYFNKLRLYLNSLRFFTDANIVGVGGNHDDFFKLTKFMHSVNIAEGVNKSNVYLNITDPSIGLTDYQKDIIVKHKPKNVFMHYPVGDCPHKFMNTDEHNIKDPIGLAKFFVDNGVHDVFCGHYHMAYNSEYVEGVTPSIHICPSIQTQLNPYVDFCDPNDKRPGFSVLTFNEGWDLTNIENIMVDFNAYKNKLA